MLSAQVGSLKSLSNIQVISALVAAVVLCSPCATSAHDAANEALLALIRADQATYQVAPDAWPDVSLNGLRNLEDHDRAALAQLHAIPRNKLTWENRELYDLFEWQVERRLDQMRVRLYLTPFWQDQRLLPAKGLLGGLDPLWSLPTPVSLDAYRERIRKFELFPKYVAQVIALLREAKAAGMLPAQQIAWRVESDGENRWLNDYPGLVRDFFAANGHDTHAERTLYAPFASMERIDVADRVRLQQEAREVIEQKVIPAIEEYYDVLDQEYVPTCPESPRLTQWPNGAELYAVLLRLHTTTDLSPEQVRRIGLEEVKRIREQMTTLLPRLGFKGSLDEFLIHARTDPNFYFRNGDELLAAYQSALQRIEPLLPEVVHDMPKISIEIRGIRGGAAAEYAAPGAQHREGLINVEIGTPSIHPKFEVIPIVLHEGLPGHALQDAIAVEAVPKTPDVIAAFRERARQSMGFSEG